MGKRNMMPLTAEWRENNPPPHKPVPKSASVASRRNSNVKKQPQTHNKGKGKAPPTNPYRKCYRIPKIQQDAMENVSDGHNHDGNGENRGSQIKISEIISEILNGILDLYIAKNYVKNHIYGQNSDICNNIKTKI
ncbi:hypothetical protein O181_024191 [Austropuccinia psidii MF-1]|uniref:Uncharacterized protein n=1 Tax=Austropuccinia psidii MF-1 TaxID=1389203 RepID=A0A9Q3CKX7_9BASI|nr:hypothetical protein [Austropuccinia psidii MF-1]